MLRSGLHQWSKQLRLRQIEVAKYRCCQQMTLTLLNRLRSRYRLKLLLPLFILKLQKSQ
jgi:hypothetical protein